LKDIPDDLRFSFTNADGKDAYPIAGTTWMVLYVKQPADKAEKLKEFATWLVHDGQDMNKELHYARIPPSIVAKADKLVAGIGAKSQGSVTASRIDSRVAREAVGFKAQGCRESGDPGLRNLPPTA